MSSLCQITLKRYAFRATIGVSPEERSTPQTLLLSLTVTYDAALAIATDALEGALDYDALTPLCLEVAKSAPRLLETLAARMLDALFAAFPLVSCSLTLSKARLEHLSITLERHA